MADSTVEITTSGKEYKPLTTTLLAQIFHSDPVITFLLSSLPTSPTRETYRPSFFSSLLRAAALNDAVFQEANNFSAVAVWIKPGKSVVNYKNILQSGILSVLWKIGFGGVKRMLVDFVARTEEVKEKWLVKKKVSKEKGYYYLFFIGTVKEFEGRGLAKGIIRKWQERCVEEGGVAIWLEATTEKSRDVYVKCGFEVLEEIVLGRGTHSKDGEFEKDGEGVKVWAMLWKPSGEGR